MAERCRRFSADSPRPRSNRAAKYNAVSDFMARPEGFEPTALCFGGTRSIHLSYGRAVPNFLVNSLLKLNQIGTSSNKPHNHTSNERQPPRDGKSSAHRASFVRARLQPCRKRFRMA